jgi:competence protein ComEC
MRVDVLKADHHGSCNGVTERYLDATRPLVVVVPVGAINDYGHMHVQAKNALARRQIPWYRTDRNGTITIRSSGTAGSKYSIRLEHRGVSLAGRSDRVAHQPKCAGM